MKKVNLGNTGLEVSRICFGTLTVGPVQGRFPIERGGEVLAYGIEKGINFFDTAELYETYPYIKYAMDKTGKRDIVVSSKTYAYTAEMAHKAVEEARRELDRDYIDIFMLHEQESIHTLRGHMPALEVFYDYKAKGIIKAVGASMHHVAAVEGAIETGLDVIHPLINVKGLGVVDGTREDMENAIKKAYEKGMGVFSMKSLGGGNLFKSAEECLTYAVNNPYLHSVAIGMQSEDEVDANIEFFTNGYFTPGEKASLDNKNRKLHIDDWCIACGECVSRCGQKALSIKDDIAFCNHDKCILCGYCSTVCPMWAIKVV